MENSQVKPKCISEPNGLEGENKYGRMKGEKQSGQVIVENSQVKPKFMMAILCHLSDEKVKTGWSDDR